MTSLQLNSILLVDDDEVTHFYVEHLIRKMNLAKEVHVALSGQDAMTYLSSALECESPLPDLILLDINMPIMNGFEFLDAFEQSAMSKQYRGKIFMLTSSGLDQDRARAANYTSLSGYFTKPLNTVLLDEIAQQCGAA
jgi:CheY-like chemotaxis protein